MKLTEEKRFCNFYLRLFPAEVRLNVVGMCITEAVRVLLSSTSSRTENLDRGCLIGLIYFDFHLNAFSITLCPKCDISM